jgi:hypothetical protein
MVVAIPALIPPARLLRRTTAVDTPGVSTSGSVTATKPHTGITRPIITAAGLVFPRGHAPSLRCVDPSRYCFFGSVFGAAEVFAAPPTFELISRAIFWCSWRVGSVLAAHAFNSGSFPLLASRLNDATSLL